jgi:hypothetical protein
MNGHHELITMRRAGFKPDAVWISDTPCPTDWARWKDHPQICVAGDTPEIEDFRFLKGIEIVIVEGFDADRVTRISKACEAHAKRVIANVSSIDANNRVALVSTTDTQGHLTWPQ